MRRLIEGGTIVNEGSVFDGSIVVEGKDILTITEGNKRPELSVDETIDASGCFVLPGIIDDHVHFREPGLTAKADIDTESQAAAAGGVTSYFDMPSHQRQQPPLPPARQNPYSRHQALHGLFYGQYAGGPSRGA